MLHNTIVAFSLCTLLAYQGHARILDSLKNGIYFTDADFANNSLNEANRIVKRSNGSISITSSYTEVEFRFGSIYGYRKDNIKYRAYGSKRKFCSPHGYYRIVDESGLIIYSKPATSHRLRGYVFYYYSKSVSSPIRRITKKNLKQDFSDNPAFLVKALDAFKRKELLLSAQGKVMLNKLYLRE